MPWANTRANILTAGISKIQIKASGDDAYYDLKDIREGKMVAKLITDANTKKMKTGRAIEIEISAKVMRTDKVKVLESLDALAGNDLDVIATGINGTTFSSENLTVPFMGLDFDFNATGDLDVDRNLLVVFSRRIDFGEWDDLIDTVPADGTPDAGDILYALNGLARSSIHPSGIAKWEYQLTGAGTWGNDFGRLRKAVFSIKLKTVKDNYGRALGQGQVDVMVKAEMMQASATELALLAGSGSFLGSSEFDHRITLQDGAIFTFTNQLGLEFSYNNESDSDDIAFIPVEIQGAIPVSLLDGIIT